MKIAYIANIRIPTEKAHGLQIMKTCEALALAGQSVTLIVPTRDNLITADPFDYYKVALRFPVVRLENPDFVHWGFFGFLIQTLLFARKAKAYVKNSDADIVFGRDEMVLCSIPSVKPVMWETHTGRSNRWAKNLAHRARGIIAITKGLKDLYISQGVAADSIVVAPDAVDIAQFDAKIDRDDARALLGLPKEERLAIYTGHLYGWKGVDILARAAALLPEDFHVVFVGGTDADIARFRKSYGPESGLFASRKIMIVGHEPHEKMPLYMKAADVLVLPNTSRDTVSRLYTSPMKLFEYMASERPIVASRLPSISEVLNDSNAFLVPADDPNALAEGIVRAVLAEGRNRALRARADVEAYSWKKRAESLVSFIQSRI